MSYSSQIATEFTGPSSSTNPPHNGLAGGPNNVVMVEGSRIEWTDLSGGSPTVQSTYNFFSSLSPTGGLYDQRCVYDSVNQRYIVIMQYGASGASAIDIAVSKDSNPNDGWYFASLNTSLTINGQLTGSDRPMLSIDGSNIYITAAQYDVNISGYVGTESWVIGDTAGPGGGLYNGGTLTVTANQLASPSQGVFGVTAGNNGKTYYASDYSSGGQILLALQTYDTATNAFGPVSTISLGNIDQGVSNTAQQLGTNLLLDAGDRRIASMVYANGFLYAVAEMEPIGSSVPAVHWFKIDVSNPNAPTLVAQGDISGAAIGTNVATFNPSIAVDGAGDVIINFTASGPNMYPADYYVFQGGRDPTGSFSAPILYQASTGFFNSGNGSSVQRWGVNSSATVDPNNPNSFWISNEYVANNWWQTSVARIAIQNLGGTAPTSIVPSGTGIANGGGDLSAGKVVTLTVNFSAAVTVNTTGGTPTLTLNDGGTATYTGGSGTTALTFSYTVAAGQNTPDLVVSSFNLNGATVKDGAGNAADLSGATNYNPAGILQIDTIAPVPAFSQEPAQVTSSSTAVFAFTTSNTETNGVSYAYKLDGATTWTAVTGSTLSLSGLANGSHAIQVQATDGAGNVSAGPASYNWTVTPSAAQIETQFAGPSVTSTYPPNNGLAVGPNNVVMMEGSRIEWTNLAGGSPTLQSVYNFFSPLGSTAASSLNHPRAVYDSTNQRYIVVMDNSPSGHTISNIDIAVSKDSNPNDGWYFASLNTSLTINGQLTAADSPMVSVDGTNVYITTSQYNVNVSGYAGTECWVIGDTTGAGGGLYNGGTPTVVANQITQSTQSIFKVVAGNNGKTYYASDYSTGGGQVVVTLQTYDAATNTFGPASTISLGNIDQGGAYTAQQLGTSLLLDASDNRTRNLAYANGFLYGVTEIKPIGSSVPTVHWFKIDVSNPNAPTLVAQGDITGAAIGANVATFNPSIAVDAAGDVMINFTASGPNMYPGDYYVYQRGSDPPGSFSGPALYQASTGFFNSGNGASLQPWGNYSSATVDPNNPNSFWISNEYVANNWWQTSIAEVLIQNPTATAPTVSSIATSGTGITNGAGDLNAGQVVTLTVNFSAAVTVNTTGGTPTLTLNDGGIATYTGGSGSTALTFSYTVAAGQNTPDLVVSSFNLNGATVKDGAGNVADLSGATNNNPAGILQIDTIPSTVSSIAASGPGITNGSGNLGTGQVVTLTVNMSEAVTINTTGGTPTLTLNDGGIATYTGGSGTTALTFSYTVAAGQNTPDLVVSSFNLNGATVKDGAGNVADLSAATNFNPAGTLQISTTALTVSSIATSGTGITNGAGDLNAGQVVALTVNFSAAVTVNTTGGAPTLTLNDGGTATYTGGSGTTALTFSYTVAAGQNTPDLVVSSFNLNGATVKDGAGNAADLSGVTNYNPAGILQIDTIAPVPAFSQEPAPVTSSSTAVFAFTTSNTETNGVSYAYKLDGATTWTAVTGSTLSLSSLANGSHAIQVQATDGAGNVSAGPASYNWTIALAVAQIETQFSGPSVTSTYPPNNGLAVGPNNVVMMEGSRIEWTNLTGGSPTLQSVYNFFSPLGSTAASSLNHPRAVYDSTNQRYIVVMDNSPSGHTISNIDIAVSKDSNPNDGWYFASLNTSLTINGQLTAADSPMVSVDGTNIYITATQYNVNVSGTAGTESWVIGDTAGGGIYNGGTLTVLANQLLPSNQSIFKVVAGNNGKTYYASDYSPGGSQVVVTLETYDAPTNTFGPATTLNLGNIDQGGAYTAQQLGTSLLLDASDKRLRSLAYANGFLYGVTEVKPIGASVPAVHWFKIDVSNPNAPTLVAQGDITGAAIGANVTTFNPSIAVDAAGDVMINFTASGPNMYPGDYYVYQRGSDPPGSFSGPALYQASTGFFNSGNGASLQPWGNYSSATVDPNNPNSFWISNEYVANNWWQTSVAKVAIETAEAPTLTIANTSLNVTAGGSVPLGITATPVDSDDMISVKISGVPIYETVTAPSGVTVTSSLQADGTNTWIVTEGASTTGAPLTALTLSSSYTGSGHPVATFTLTASNTAPGEAATSVAQTITVTDPPAMASAGAPNASQRQGIVASTPNPGQIDRLVALMDQFTAAGFHEDQTGAGAMTWMLGPNGSHEDLAFLAAPRFRHA